MASTSSFIRRIPPSAALLLLTPLTVFLEKQYPESHTLLFILSICALMPLAMVLNTATEIVAQHTGDMIGGLVTSTFGNMTELIISLTALHAGEILLVKSCITGAITTKCLFVLGASFLFGGLRYKTQEFNKVSVHLQTGLLFLASIGLLIPTFLKSGHISESGLIQKVSDGNAVILLLTYALGLVFSLKTHQSEFASQSEEAHETPAWPLWVAGLTLGLVTVGIAFVSEVFVASVQEASANLGMTTPFVGIIIVSLVGAGPEMTAAIIASRKNHLDLSVSIAVGSASQVALFMAPLLVMLSHFIAASPMDLIFWPGAVLMIMIATFASIIVTSGGRSAWFLGVFLIAVYLMFATALYFLKGPAS